MTFYEKMRVVCLAIPAGKVAAYGQTTPADAALSAEAFHKQEVKR